MSYTISPTYAFDVTKLRPIDDSLMRSIFRGHNDLVQLVTRIVIGKPDLVVTSSTTQYDLNRLNGAHSVKFDVFAHDTLGTMYDIEFQTGSIPDPKRARYYGSAMDIETLDAGQGYDELPERWVIFIMEGDPFNARHPVYHFIYREEDTRAPFGDGTHFLYVNASHTGDDDLGRLSHDLLCADPADMLIPELRDRVQYLKTNPEEVKTMASYYDEALAAFGAEVTAKVTADVTAKVTAEVTAKTREEDTLSSIRTLMESMDWTVTQAMDALRISDSERPNLFTLLSAADSQM